MRCIISSISIGRKNNTFESGKYIDILYYLLVCKYIDYKTHMLFFRIIILLSIVIIFLFWYNYCNSSQDEQWKNWEDISYTLFLQEALGRNSPPSSSRQVSFSMEEFFWNQHPLYQKNKEQIELREYLQRNFNALILWNKELFSLEQNDSQIEKKLEQERWVQTTSLRTNQSSGISTSGWSWRCVGLIFDPCIVVWEDIPPPGIMEFGIWRWSDLM